MEVTFYKLTEKRLSYWEARRGKRTRVPGSTMALGRGGPPHDLLQMVVEARLGLDRGFWGSVAAGATFRSTGRKRTRPGRAVIQRNRQHLDAAESAAGEHVRRWTSGQATPCGPALDEVARRWAELADGEGMVLRWPTLERRGTTVLAR